MRQEERINQLCDELMLEQMKLRYGNLSQEAAKQQRSYSDFFENLLHAEIGSCSC